jgi:glycosyltransferase involved in cell wall biosynthesis
MLPSISVIIPAYNAEKEISKTIQSVLNQTLTDYEIIVVNDGSTDGTLNKLDVFGNKIRVVDQLNGGVSKARNVGIDISKGKYIAFLDSDDLWHPSKLAIQFELMENNKDWLACYTLTDFNKEFLCEDGFDSLNIPLIEKNIQEIYANPYLVTSSFFIVNNFCKSIGGFNESLPTAEDIDLYLRTSAKGSIGYIDLPLTWKADTEGSLGSLLSSYEDNIFVIDNFLKKNPQLSMSLSVTTKQIKAQVYQNWGKELLWVNQPIKALPIFMKSQCFKFSMVNCLLIIKGIIKSIYIPFSKK